jgi:hypothetical protein
MKYEKKGAGGVMRMCMEVMDFARFLNEEVET